MWNIDLTLVDVARVTRAAYAEAFEAVTGRPLVRLPQMAGRTESEIFFEALARNEVDADEASEQWLDAFTARLAESFAARRDLLAQQGRLLPGAREAVAALAEVPGLVQTVLTGCIKPNAVEKLHAFGLAEYLDTEVGGYGSEVYPKGALLLNARTRAAARYGVAFTADTSVFIADSVRDVEAAQTGGARCLAVASGRSIASELRHAGADLVLADLSQTDSVVDAVRWLTAGAPG
jgi:phosphoglycolate phosphatase